MSAERMLSSLSSRYTTCRAEASAETNPGSITNPHSHHSLSTEACPCSLVAEVDPESNLSELLDLNISRPCDCLGVPLAEVNTTEQWDSICVLAEESTTSSISSDFNCSSTSPGRSIREVPSSPGQEAEAEAEAEAWPDRSKSSKGELKRVGTRHSMLVISDSGFGRSAQEEGSSSKALGKTHKNVAEAALSCVMKKEEGSSRSVGDRREIGEGKSTCSSYERERSIGVEDFGEPRNASKEFYNKEQYIGSGCVSNNRTKGREEGCSETANAESSLTKHGSSELLARQGGSSQCAAAKSGKRPRLLNCIEMSSGMLSRATPINANGEMACSSVEDPASEQQPYVPGLDKELALRCLAFVPLCDLGRLSRVSRQYRDLVKSGLILKLRRTYGTVEHLVFIYASGPGGWTAYDAKRNVWKTLPPANADPDFISSDKESLSAGTHVLWFGKVMFDFVYYRYDLLTNSWDRGPSMINPRCLFASASCGEFAYVAGGFGPADNSVGLTLLNSAEKYNSLTGFWERLPPMSTPRHKCSGFFMDGNFFVIGGRDANHQPIMSGEVYNPSTGVWRTIPNMFFAPEIHRRGMVDPSPPLVAVVNNQLYAVENTTNALKLYNKQNNTWTNLGYLPVPADLRNGWGVAFKALGDRLFVMGDLGGIAACCWRPGPKAAEPDWQLLSHRERGVNSFLFNCAVMTC